MSILIPKKKKIMSLMMSDLSDSIDGWVKGHFLR